MKRPRSLLAHDYILFIDDNNICLGRFQVWDREIIQTALAEFYDKDMDTFRKQLEHNLTKVSEEDGCYLRNWRSSDPRNRQQLYLTLAN